MNKLEFEKLVQVLVFFATKNGGKVNKLKAIKLLFFADRYHIRKYGRPVVWSTYYAMKNGPVSSEALDVENLHLDSKRAKEVNRFLEKKEKFSFESKENVNEDVFSETDLEALNFAWNVFGHFGEFELANITHAYPEWRKYKEYFEEHPRSRKPMNFRDFFNNNSDKKYLKKKLGRDPFENVKSEVAEFELEEEEKAREILDC